jgi:tetratricopeptide (TPR) repeat protein
MSFRLFMWLLLGSAGLAAQTSDPLSRAEDLYRHTDYQASLDEASLYQRSLSRGSAAYQGSATYRGSPAYQPSGALAHADSQTAGKVHYLIGRDHFMLGDYKSASEAFERAFSLEPGNSDYALWLGRSFGRRAETGSPFFAPHYASKARAYFEKSVALNSNNEEALNDLFDYYLEAPGFLGGGYDKAEALARRIAAKNPAEGHFAEAQLADRRKEFDSAEQQLRRAIELAPRQVGRVLDLARHLARHGRTAESEAVFDQAEQLAPNSPKVAFARAQMYVEQKRNLNRARALLRQYLESDLTPDDPSREQAEKLLKEASGA